MIKEIKLSQIFFSLFVLTLLFFAVVTSGALDLWAQTGLHLGVFVCFLFLIFNQIKSESLSFPKVVVSPAFGLIVLGIILSYLFTLARWNSRAELFNWITYVMFFWFGWELQNRKSFVVNGLLFCSLPVIVIQLFQKFFQGMNTPVSTLVNENILAGYYVLLIPIALIKSYQQKKWVELFWVIPLLIGLFMTGSLGAWISLGVVVVWYLYENVFNKLKSKSLILISISIIILVVVSILIYKLNQAYTVNRLGWWTAAVKMVLQNPFTGVGLDNFARYFPQYKVAGLNSLYAHNHYLQLAAELGVFGLVGFLWLIYVFVKQGKKDLVISLGLFAVLIQNFVDYNLAVPAIAFLFWFLLGLAWEKEENIVSEVKYIPRIIVYGITVIMVTFLCYENVKLFIANRNYAQGTYFLKANMFAEAEKKFLNTLSLAEDYSPANYGLSIAYANQFAQGKVKSKLYESMIEMDEAIKKEKKYAPYWIEKGWLYCWDNNLNSAEKSLQRAKLLGAIPAMTEGLEGYISQCKR